MILGASLEEAEDATQKAMEDFIKRTVEGRSPISNPAAYVRQAAFRFFIKERKRDLERLPRELRGGHLTPEGYLDDQLTALEDEQYVEHLLGCLTETQRDVVRRVLAGMSTKEIAEELGKTDETIRQHLKNARTSLKKQPEVATLKSRNSRGPGPAQGVRSTATTPEPREEEVQ